MNGKDPYALCPCGMGTKQKWCVAKSGMAQLDKAIGMVQSNQQEASLAFLDRLIADQTQPECFRAYAANVKGHALSSFERKDEAYDLLEEAVAKFPESAVLYECRGDVDSSIFAVVDALDSYLEALAHYPVAAEDQICRTLWKIGSCHHYLGRPLAAWAAYCKALKINPQFENAKKALEESIRANVILPNQARHGLQLKSADEFTLFDEEMGEKWERAASDGQQMHIDDLVMDFEALTARNPGDASAWYNLGVSLAWAGENLRAIDALRRYVELENDSSAAADAWDLAEVLRLGAGAEDASDCLFYIARYEMHQPEALFEQLRTSRHVIVAARKDDEPTLHWLDKEREAADSSVPILGGPPRIIAQFVLTNQLLEVVAHSQVDLDTVLPRFESVAGNTVKRLDVLIRRCDPFDIDPEPFQYLSNPRQGEAPIDRLAETRKYYEEKWIHRPLKALGGLAPVDAAQGASTRNMLEGVIRFRERIVKLRGVEYNFDRLRNKLGLSISGAGLEGEDRGRPSSVVDLSAYSAAQLAALDPEKLSDDELVAAYQSALHLDATHTARNFAAALARRDSAANKIDMVGVFRRWIQSRLDDRNSQGLRELIHQARGYSERHYQGRDAAVFDLLEARAELLDGSRDEAVSRIRTLIERYPDRLDVAASAVESLLTIGDYRAAKEVAEQGLSVAEEHRSSDFQGQFREYARAAAARV